MIALDTDVVLRYFVKDDPEQGRLAKSLMESLTAENPGWISLVVLAELVWLLKRTYRLEKEQIATIIDKLLASRHLNIEESERVDTALQLHRNTRAGFADCLLSVSARAAGCSTVVTFDKIAARDLRMQRLGQP